MNRKNRNAEPENSSKLQFQTREPLPWESGMINTMVNANNTRRTGSIAQTL